MAELEIQPRFPDSKANVLKPHYFTSLNSLSALIPTIIVTFSLSKYLLKSYCESFDKAVFKNLCFWSLYSRQWFSTGDDSAPQETHDNIWRPFQLSQLEGVRRLCATGSCQVQARHAEHPTRHRKATHNKGLSSPKC